MLDMKNLNIYFNNNIVDIFYLKNINNFFLKYCNSITFSIDFFFYIFIYLFVCFFIYLFFFYLFIYDTALKKKSSSKVTVTHLKKIMKNEKLCIDCLFCLFVLIEFYTF